MAAETGPQDNANPWPLLSKELEFVAGLTRDVKAAKDFLEFHLRGGRILWGCGRLVLGRGWTSEAALKYFWLVGSGSLAVDYDKSYAIRHGPPLQLAEFTFNNLPAGIATDGPGIIFNPESQSTVEAHLITLRHSDVLRELHAARLLPEPMQAAAPASQAPLAAKLTPAKWFVWALKNIPRNRGERTRAYAVRLHDKMEAATNVEKTWTLETIERRLRGDRKSGKAGRQKTGKNRQKAATSLDR